MIMFDPVSASLFCAHRTYIQRAVALAASLNDLNKFHRKVTYKFASNNWLKMHGYPMRRK